MDEVGDVIIQFCPVYIFSNLKEKISLPYWSENHGKCEFFGYPKYVDKEAIILTFILLPVIICWSPQILSYCSIPRSYKLFSISMTSVKSSTRISSRRTCWCVWTRPTYGNWQLTRASGRSWGPSFQAQPVSGWVGHKMGYGLNVDYVIKSHGMWGL